MDRREYRTIKAQLDFSRHFGVTLALLLLDGLLLALALWLIAQGGVVHFLCAQLLLSLLFFHAFCLLHEAGHGNCARGRVLNTLVGLYTSVLCFTPYVPWQHIHQRHHVWAGNPARDPTAQNLLRWRAQGRVPAPIRLAWRSWLPLGALAQHVVFWRYPLTMLAEDRRLRLRTTLSVLLLPVSYAGLYLAWPALFHPRNFALAFVIYLFAEELVNLPHHADLFLFDRRLPLWEQWRAARSAYYPPLVSELLVLNFNFHTEHHLYPSLPWYRLRGARALVKAQLGERYQEATGIGWNIERRARSIEAVLLRGEH